MTEREMVLLAVKKAGSLRKLGQMLGINYQLIQKWERIPAERVIELEAILDIPREQLRPDLYPPPRELLGLK